jgi:CHAT domain-containing protein
MRTPTPPVSGGFLGLGDPPSNDDPAFPPLAHARASLERIAAGFPPGSATLLMGEDLTKAALEDLPLREFRYVHFATHTLLDPERPRYLGLRLGPGEEGADSFLYMHEIPSLDLDAELVTLSSCRSGLGEMLRGEGLNGLTRAFLQAGARAVLVSLWNVDDRSTGEFMEVFYREIRAGRPPAEALRLVKLGFLRSERPLQRHPRRWAPFVLVGVSGPAKKN